MTTDITELAQSLKAEDISSERMEWLKKLADMEYCASNPGHWLMNLKETNYLASLALQCLESNSTLVEALEKAQETIAFQQGEIKALLSSLESRTVKLPDALLPATHKSGELFMTPDNVEQGGYLNRDDVLRVLRAAGIKVEAE